MAEHPLPAIPITTLAGLTSTSDLLSELPVADILGATAHSQKSLLFHTLVANEANHLLSLRDESLVRQLVHALEKTNSENIILKPQYFCKQREYVPDNPGLLSEIYKEDQTVFNYSQNNQTGTGIIEERKKQLDGYTEIPAGSAIDNYSFRYPDMRSFSVDPPHSAKTNTSQANDGHNIGENIYIKNGSELANPEPGHSFREIGEVVSRNDSDIKDHTIMSTMPPWLHQEDADPQNVADNKSSIPTGTAIPTAISKSHVRAPEHAIKFGLLSPRSMQSTDEKVDRNISTKKRPSSLESSENIIVTPPADASDAFTIIKSSENLAKRRKEFNINDVDPEEIYSRPKVRRVERATTNITEKFSKDEVSRSQTYQQFLTNMEHIIELLDDTESPNFDSDEVDENIECISSKMLINLSNDVAKLKAKHALNMVPKNKLTLLINYAMRNIYVSKNYSAGPDEDDDLVDNEVIEKVLAAMEACLLVCNIYSAVNELKFLQEDNISLIIKFVQFQFRETIFPLHDPVYTLRISRKSDNRKKSKTYRNHSKNLQLFYSKSVELMKIFVTLFDKCTFVDTIILPLSTLAIEPFFVDNVETLQFICLELITTIFRKEPYEKIRSSILNDILASIDRLPTSRKNLRPFKLNNNAGNIQMVSALVLQLIQCATTFSDSLPSLPVRHSFKQQLNTDSAEPLPLKTEKDLVVLKKYDVAISIGGNFLKTFLAKCKTRSNETDFRPLFENFIYDLLSTVNKPEWPASELLLSLLGTMLVRYVSDKTIEQSIRLVSLDYLGIVAARLRKDTVESTCKAYIIDSMIKSIRAEQEKEGDPAEQSVDISSEGQQIEFLQNVLLDFLAVNAHEENLIWDYARHFYITQWYRDLIFEGRRINNSASRSGSRKKKTMSRKRRSGAGCSDLSESSTNDELDVDMANSVPTTSNDKEIDLEKFELLNSKKQYLLDKISLYNSSNKDLTKTAILSIKTYIDYKNAYLIAQYLATKRPFSQSFDGYLKKIILVVNEPSIAIRTRAMKCLANIVEVDPMVLKRKDMQMGVNQKFLDPAISVREAAVDLVGKFVLSNEELIDQYYDMLSGRILDTGVSVRKRVIKILRDICIEYPDFKKIPEICVKMVRRVSDEEGIQKLVTDVFMKMWFLPCPKNDKLRVQRKISQIIDVVNTAHDTGTSWLEGLLNSIFQPKEQTSKLDDGAQSQHVKRNTGPPPEILLACQQLADGLVDRLIELEELESSRMLGCMTALHLLSRVQPQLLVRHAITIEPYLNINCQPQNAPKFICAVAEILEKVVPLVNNASSSFLASLEEHLMVLAVSRNQAEVTSCVSCLGAVINKVTKNYKLIRDCFKKFYKILSDSKLQVQSKRHPLEHICSPTFRRSVFTIGILMRYFDFNTQQVIGNGSDSLPASICDDVFDCLMFFCQCSNSGIQKQSLVALGSFFILNDEYLTKPRLKEFYCDLLRTDAWEPSFKVICMRNIWMYLTEAELDMYNKEKEWEKQSKNEDLKEMNDVSSGMASRIIQLYLEEILECFLHSEDSVRLWAVKVVQIVLRQGLVHPVRMVPFLVCLSTDQKLESAHRADALLKDIDKTYTGFVNMKVQLGLKLSFKLQEVLQSNLSNVIRGYIKRDNESVPIALNDFLYTLLRATKPQRRALVQTVTKQFDDNKTSLQQMLYIADNLAYFPYVVQDEPLYLIHQIDLLISMTGTHLLGTFKKIFNPTGNSSNALEDDDDEDEPDVLFKRLPADVSGLVQCTMSAQACMLLLILKEHLKEMYGFTDSKISRYSPSDQKMYEKSIVRKAVPDFNPTATIEIIKKQATAFKIEAGDLRECMSNADKKDLVANYLNFKQLMLKLDPDEANSDADETREKAAIATSGLDVPAHQTAEEEINNVVREKQESNSNTAKESVHKQSALTYPRQTAKDGSPGILTSTRKSSLRIKLRKRRIISSDDEETNSSDEDYHKKY